MRPRCTNPRKEPAAIPQPDPAAGPHAAEALSATEPPPRPARRAAREERLTFETMPREKEIEAKVHRRSIGRNLTAICGDLGVARPHALLRSILEHAVHGDPRLPR